MLMTAKKPPFRPRMWQARAVHLLNQALYQVRSEQDAIPTVSAALACLRIEIGELPADELDFMFPDPAEDLCICRPELCERGGFSGGCPVHRLVSLAD